jgi:pimeloyl-ACP methyl ester carboxylesterase
MHDVALSIDGLPIHYEVQGEGLPGLVFIHGWSCNRRHWQQQMAYFALQYTVVAIDLGGHGDSGLDRAVWTMAAFAEDIAAVVEKLGLTQIVLIGHSLSGTIVVEAAQRLPAQVIGIVGVDTFKVLEGTMTKAEIEAFLEPFRLDFVRNAEEFVRTNMFIPSSDPALVDRIARDMTSASPAVGISAGEEEFSHAVQRRASLLTMQIPKVLINSDYTPTDQAATARYGIRVEMMTGVGHFVMLEDPATFNRILGNVVQGMIAEAGG